jgi:hypothetical protein
MASTSIIVFQAISPADLGFTNVFLTDERADHISSGHRDIGALPNQLIRTAVEQPTHVYDSHIAGRFQFMSANVSRSGRPMVVIVERRQDVGEIITATWKDKINYPIIWEADSDLYANLDEGADILYVSKGPAIASYAVEDNHEPDIWYRFSDKDNSHTGVTVFRALDRSRRMGTGELARIIAAFLGISETQIRQRIEPILI